MTKNIVIIILITLLILVSFIFFVKANLAYSGLRNLKKEYRQSEVRQLEKFSKLMVGYNKLQEKYDKLKYQQVKDGWETYEITGYSANDLLQGTTDITVTGFQTDCGLPIIAVDPLIIPLYSIVAIKGLGAFIALDTGGLITGNRIDILFQAKEEALEFGVRQKEVKILN